MKIEPSGNSLVFSDLQKHFQSLPTSQILLLHQVALVIKFVLLMPATNAVSERSASAMRWIKTYLHSTMSQQRMNIIYCATLKGGSSNYCLIGTQCMFCCLTMLLSTHMLLNFMDPPEATENPFSLCFML